MKKIAFVSFVVIVLMFAFAGCGAKMEEPATTANNTSDSSKSATQAEKVDQNPPTPVKPDTKPPKTENQNQTNPKRTDIFDNASISFTIPEGFTVNESYPYIELTKENQLEKTVKFNVTPMVETVDQAVSDFMVGQSGKVTDVTIGSFMYKKISMNSSDIGLINLVTTNGKSLVRISILDLGDSQVREILNSLKIK
jgi:hypothetical protein